MAAGAAGILGTLRILVDADSTKAQSTLKKLGGSAGLIGTAIGGAMGLAGIAALKMGDDYKNASDAIRIGTGATGEVLEALKSEMNDVAGRVPDSLAVVGQALADVSTRTGRTGDELGTLTESFLDMSRMLGVDVSTSIANVTRMYGDWSIAAEDQIKTNDLLMRASQATGIGIDELSSKLVEFGAPLRNIGMGFEDATAMLSKWEKEGVNTTLALGGMKQALGKFAQAGVDVKEGLADLIEQITNADSATEAMALGVKMFGKRAGPDMVAAIREGRFEFADFTDELVSGTETVQGLSDDTRDMGDAFKEMGNRLKTAVGPITSVFAGVAESMGNAIYLLPAMTAGIGNALGRAVGSAPVKAIAAKGGALISAAMAAGMKGASALIGFLPTSITNAARAAIPSATLAGTTLGTAFGVAFKAAAIVGIAIVSALILQELGKRTRNLIDDVLGTDFGAGDRFAAQRAEMEEFGKTIGVTVDNVHQLVLGKMVANGFEIDQTMGKFGGHSAEAFEREYNRAWATVRMTNGPDQLAESLVDLEGQLDDALAGLDVEGPDVASGIRESFALATAEAAKGFGSIKAALQNPPKLISKDDRLDNMAGRMKKVMGNMKRAIAAEDPWSITYWEKARAAQQRQIDKLKGRHVASMGEVKGVYKRGGVSIKGTWSDVERKTKTSADKGADEAISAFDRITDWFSSHDLVASGSNLIGGLITGIQSRLPELIAAATGAAQTIADRLEMHSPAKTGPLSTADRWGEGLMDTWLKPIERSEARVAKLGVRLGNALTPQPALGGIATTGAGATLGAAGAARGDTYQVGVLVANEGGLDELDRRMERRRRRRSRGRGRYAGDPNQ